MGEVVDVAGGYARNYLIPRGLALAVTRGKVKEIEERKKVLEVKAVRMREQLESVADKISSQKIVIKARCSKSGKLFGSITRRQLAGEIETLAGEEIDRHKIVMDERIRTVGVYHALLKLHPDVEIDIEFEVEGEGFVPEEPAEEEAHEAEVNAEGGPESPEAAAAQETTADEEASSPADAGLMETESSASTDRE
jgi:large subunit ribosomal protein L9